MFSFSLQIAIFALTISSVKSRVLLETAPQDHVTFAECALYVTQRYISTRTNNLFIMENCANCNAMERQFHSRLLDYYLRNFTDARIPLQLNFGDENIDQPVNYNLLIVNNALSFNLDKLKYYNSSNMHEPEFYFLILLTYTPGSLMELYKEMYDIFTKCVKFNVLNAIITSQDPNGNISFYTYNLFRTDCKRRISTIRYNRYNMANRLKNDYLFPTRLRDFHNCTLHVAVRILPPLLDFSGDKNKTQHSQDIQGLTGIDGELIQLLSKSLKFQFVLYFPHDTSVVGSDQNLTGCLEMLQQRKVDIAIGGLSATALKRHILTASSTYHHGALVFVVCSGLHFGPIKQLLIEFRTTVWLLIGFTIFVGFQFVKIIEKSGNGVIAVDLIGPSNASARLNIISALFGNPISRLPRTHVGRFVVLTWLAMTLVLRSAYQAKMFDALRLSRRLPTPKDINELIRQEYLLLARTTYDFYPENFTIIGGYEDFNKFEVRFALIEKAKWKFTSLALLDNLAHYNRLNYNTSSITYVRKPVYDFQHVFYFQKYSLLKWTFDRKLKQLMSAGIIANMAKRHVKTKFLMLNVGGTFVPNLSNRTLSGLYMIYAIAMGLAIVCFLLELVSRKPRYVRLRKFFGHSQSVDI